MTFWQSVGSSLSNLWSTSRPPLPTHDQIVRMAAKSHLSNQAKIQSLHDLVEADDYEKLAFDDREKVRQYEAGKLGRSPTPEKGRVGGGADDMGHILGDVTIQQAPNRNPISTVIVPLVATAVLGAIAWKFLDKDDTPQTNTPAPKLYGTETVVTPGFGVPEYVGKLDPSEIDN